MTLSALAARGSFRKLFGYLCWDTEAAAGASVALRSAIAILRTNDPLLRLKQGMLLDGGTFGVGPRVNGGRSTGEVGRQGEVGIGLAKMSGGCTQAWMRAERGVVCLCGEGFRGSPRSYRGWSWLTVGAF